MLLRQSIVRVCRFHFPSLSRPIIRQRQLFQQQQQKKWMATQHPQSEKLLMSQQLMDEGANLLNLGATELAMEAFMKSLSIYPTATAYYNMGNIYFQMGRVPDARESWQKSIEMDGKYADTYVNLGNLELGLGGNPEKAVELYQKAIELDPKDGEIRFNLAVAFDKTGRLSEAVQEYQLARKYLQTHLKSDQDREKLTALESMLRNAMARQLAEQQKKEALKDE